MKKNRCALAYANAPLGTQWGKRILSTLLAVVLCLGLLPGAAFAAGTYTPADVDAVLDRVVKNQTTVGAGDTAYDVDKDGKLTSWDAKLMLDAMPSSIKVNAMQIDGNADSTERPSWVSLEIQDGKLVRTTTINKFWNTLKSFTTQSIYPEAAALNGEDLVLRVSRSSDDTSTSLPDTLLQVDPDSFVACEQPRPSGPAADLYYIPTWDDATTLSNGQLLGVFTDPTANGGIAFFLMDGENNKKITTPKDFPKLVGIAAAGEKDGNELLYGITSGRELYSFTLTKSVDGKLTIGELTALGNSDFPFHDDKGRYFDSASLLYDTASGYLLAAATYFSNASGSLYSDDIGSALYLIDPAHPSDYVTVTQLDGVVLNSLYQYTQKSTAGVQVYLTANETSVIAGNTISATAEAYQYRTDAAGLVTNSKPGADDVVWTWTSSDPGVAEVENGTITGVAKGTATITATATVTIDDKSYKDSKSFEVTVRPDTSLSGEVGVLIGTTDYSTESVWATVNLKAENSGELTVSSVEKVIGADFFGGGYAQDKLWGQFGLKNYCFDSEYSYNEVSTGNDHCIADLTGAPASSEITHGDLSVTDPGYPVLVDRNSFICYFNGKKPVGFDHDTTNNQSEWINEYSAITYVGDLTVGEALALGKTNNAISMDFSVNCDLDVTCHVYYALTRDDEDTEAELQQIILFPEVTEKDETVTLTYHLCRTTIGTVAEFKQNSEKSVTSTSMDFLKMENGGFGLLVARSNQYQSLYQVSGSIWYIDLTNFTYGDTLSATPVGNLNTVTVDDNSYTVNNISALYHTGNMTMDKADLLRIVGWDKQQSRQPAPVAAPAISVLSGEGASVPAEPSDNTITVPISADVNATNGKWTVTYPAGKMTLDAASKDAGIVYYKTYDNGNGILTLAFASRDAIEKDNALFTLTFTGDGSAKDVTVTCDELNKPAGSSSSGGGGGGGSTGTDSAVALPSGVTGGSVSSSTDKAKPGDTVTITVEPDEGYVPGTVKVVDKDGKEIAVKDLGDGKYSFVMPTGKVDVQVTFAPATGGFADVPTDAYYREAVLWAVEKGVTNGVSDTLFGPDQACTRAQIVTFLWRAAGSPEPTAAGGFTDVPADAYYAKAVAWAVENGITTGVAEGVFAPDATCTRAQSVTFLFRALDGTAGTGSSFTDVPADAWYAAAVAWAVEKGVTNGISESRFGPDGDCTRAQIVTFLWRAMK